MKTNSQGSNRRILVIDDTLAIHADFQKILAAKNTTGSDFANAMSELLGASPAPASPAQSFDLSFATQGQDGFELVRQAVEEKRPFALAFVDVRMPPGWDGVETILHLWDVDPDLQIVICTAYSDYSWEEMTARLGASDRLLILKKPFDAVEVLQLANTLTEKWALLQQTKIQFHHLESVVQERAAELETANEQLRTEIRERELAAKQLLDIQNKLNHFLSKSPAVLYSIKVEGHNLMPDWISDNFTNLTGRKLEEWYRHLPGMDFIEAPDRALIDESFNKLAEHNQVSLHYRITRSDGAIRWVRDDRQLVRNEQAQPIEIVGCWTDITEQRLLEDQLRQSQKMESIGLLAGGIAHDFNNLLTVIRCHIELLMGSEALPQMASEGLRQTLAAAERAGSLTRQLLAFSSKQIMRKEDINLNELIASFSKLLGRTLGEHITVTTETTPDLPLISADRGMIEQVLMNLAINARDAMPQGGQLALLASVRDLQPSRKEKTLNARHGRFVCISVTDTGSGIPEADLPHIFEPFFTTKRVGKGTGLGLATVYGIIKQHEGWIEIESRVDHGTTFKIFLPATAPANAASEPKQCLPHAGGNETILIVEDEPALRSLVRTTLQRQGYRVFTASSGDEALRTWSLRVDQIDLMLTDMVMPDGVSGSELARQLVARKPNLKVMFMSGYSTELNGSTATATANVPFLGKPFGPRTLAEKIRECLDGQKFRERNGFALDRSAEFA